ncbi:MAG: hypothetical protein QXP36_07640 [Conexivisphaerales archaeon]
MFKTKKQLMELNEKIDKLYDIINNINNNENDNKNINENDLINDEQFKKLILNAKSKNEIEMIKSKRKLINYIEKGQLGQIGRKKKKEEGMINMPKQNPEIPELENLFHEYDNLPSAVKKIIDNYLNNKFGININDIRNNPEILLEIVTKIIGREKSKEIEKIEKKEDNNEIRI